MDCQSDGLKNSGSDGDYRDIDLSESLSDDGVKDNF